MGVLLRNHKDKAEATGAAPGVFGFFMVSLVMLTLAGLLFRSVFVVYNDAIIDALSRAEVFYAAGWGLRFDLAAAAMMALISTTVFWSLIRMRIVSGLAVAGAARRLLATVLAAQMMLQLGDLMYFADAGRHVSYEMRDVFTDAAGLFMTAFAQHWLLILVCFVSGAFLIFYLSGVAIMLESKLIARKRFSLPMGLQHEVAMLMVLVVAVLAIRGGIGGVPQSVISAYKIGNPQQALVAMNGAYSIVYGMFNGAKDVQRVAVQLPDVDRRELMQALYPHHSDKNDAELHNYNIVFIFMEGWPAELMSGYGYDKQTTPFFDSLLDKSLVPRGVIAGGRRTTEGLFASLCSQQNPLGQTVANTRLQTMPYTCLPDILKQHGWATAFFQGTHKDTSGTGAFAQRLGFTESYGKEDMPEGRYQHGSWGAHDPDIYDFVLNKLEHMPQPFFVGINTNSTHSIEVPEGVEAVFGKDSNQNKKLSTLHFADAAMAEFFDNVRNRAYYSNTIFVLMSDHSSGKGDRRFSRYLIPGLIYADKLIPAEKRERYVSQRDIAPTLLDILGIADSPAFSGKSFWRESEDVYFADYYDAGSVYWLQGDLMTESSISQSSSVRCYDISGGLLGAPATSCTSNGERLSLQSLVFTDYSQQMLFAGNTRHFFSFSDKSSIAKMVSH